MTLFWISVVAMSLVASGLMLWPIWKKNISKPSVKQDQLNVAIFEDRLLELESELASGVLPQERYEQARNELRRDLLQNTGSESEVAGLAGSGRWMAPVVGVLVPVLAIYIYLQLGSPELVDKPPATVQASQHQGAGPSQAAGDMDTMILRLQERLQSNPNDVDGWVLLGRSLSMVQQFDKAADAYGKAYELAGEVPEIMAQYAETLALSNQGRFEGKPVELLKRAREIEPESPRILWLLGVVAAQQGDPSQAAGIWKQLLALLPPGSEAAQMVKSSIEQIGEASVAAADSKPSSSTASSNEGSQAVVAGTVKLRVDISPELKAQVAPDDIVFVFARAVKGPRMPLAAVRHQVKEL
ncbi:MAG TPA: c-type cytochrome biogenesis protein CcmI, partial [Gammaproteobacteria bacterium]|nr:c-type cytochrome biogenesis protein CcmI [Gammaproteobacteria bacterium]